MLVCMLSVIGGNVMLYCVLSVMVCWCHWYARLCVVCHDFVELPFRGIGMLDCVLSVMIISSFLFVALVC